MIHFVVGAECDPIYRENGRRTVRH